MDTICVRLADRKLDAAATACGWCFDWSSRGARSGVVLVLVLVRVRGRVQGFIFIVRSRHVGTVGVVAGVVGIAAKRMLHSSSTEVLIVAGGEQLITVDNPAHQCQLILVLVP